jgi:hypothetical protein
MKHLGVFLKSAERAGGIRRSAKGLTACDLNSQVRQDRKDSDLLLFWPFGRLISPQKMSSGIKAVQHPTEKEQAEQAVRITLS